MDIGLREWLIIGGGVVILLIILDGWRRVKGSRSALKMDIDTDLQDIANDSDESNPELPNGGARVLDGLEIPDDSMVAGSSSQHIEPSFDTAIELGEASLVSQTVSAKSGASNSSAVIDDVPLINDVPSSAAESAGPVNEGFSLDQPVFNSHTFEASQVSVTEDVIPNEQVFANALANSEAVSKVPPTTDPLFNPVPDNTLGDAEPTQKQPIRMARKPVSSDPLLDEASSRSLNNSISAAVSGLSASSNSIAPSFTSAVNTNVHSLPTSSASSSTGDSDLSVAAVLNEVVVADDENESEEESVQDIAVVEELETSDLAELDEAEDTSLLSHARVDHGPTKAPDPDNSLVLIVASNSKEGFSGQTLLQVILACGLRFGHMDIFHRFEDAIDSGPVQFSMANATQDGSFDLDAMSDQRIRAVTFYMSMNEPCEVMNAFDCMLATADTVARNLNGDLLDENRNIVRAQTQEHYRQRVRDYEMLILRRRSG